MPRTDGWMRTRCGSKSLFALLAVALGGAIASAPVWAQGGERRPGRIVEESIDDPHDAVRQRAEEELRRLPSPRATAHDERTPTEAPPTPRATPTSLPSPDRAPADPPAPAASPGTAGAGAWGGLELLRRTIAPGDKRRLELPRGDGFNEGVLDIPVLVVRGERPGPMLCLTAGIHGDELNGVEIVRHVYEHATPTELGGTLVVLPIVNIHGFRRGVRYLPDRRDLNRAFPGRPSGSTAARMAHILVTEIIRHCEALIDLHTGSLQRVNLPQIRADLSREGVRPLAVAFGVDVILDGPGPKGSLRASAVEAGIPTILYEAGEPLRFEDEEIARGVEGVRNVMGHLGMISGVGPPARAPRIFHRTRWVRADVGGIFRTDRRLGDRVARGEVLGTVTDPISNERERVVTPREGRIVGMATPQVVLPGFALFHIGMQEEP